MAESAEFRWHYLIYRITNIQTGRIYVGQHRTVNPDDNYMGSGSELMAEYQVCKENGIPLDSRYKKEILFDFLTFKEMDDMERAIVTSDFVKDPMTYNRCLGGNGCVNHPKGCIIIEFNGRSGSLREWSEWIGLSPEIIRQRTKKGMSMQQIIDLPPRERDKIWTNSLGESHTLNEWAKLTGQRYGCISGRLRMGWSVDEALYEQTQLKRYPYKGKMLTLDELEALSPVSKKIIWTRFHNYKWSIERAVDTVLMPNPVKIWKRKFEWRGQLYTIDELVALSDGKLFRQTIKDRLDAGWDMEKIMATPSGIFARPLEKRVRFEYDGQLFTMDQAIAHFGISESVIRKRMKAGMTFKQAIDTPLERHRNELIEINGEKHTLNEWSSITGIPYAVLRNRIRLYKMSPEEAISKPFRVNMKRRKKKEI